MKVITISQLTTYIKEKIESDLVLSNLWVKGEISNFKHHSSGHMYFTLKDRTSSLRSIMFRSRNQNLQFIPQEGMSVIARGYVTVYERDGQYQLYVEEMQPDGVGALYTAYLQLKERLEKEGLFDPGLKKVLPSFPRRIGVVTSPTGAAIRDIITVMTRRFPGIHIVIIPVKVQGDEAPTEIANGIKAANDYGELDVLVVGRGGGSIEELWAFNTELVARSIFESKIPVISAVGHETDFTIADFVADRRAPTPSAAAEIVVPDCMELQKHINNLHQRLVVGIKNNLSSLNEKVARVADNAVLRRPGDGLYKKMMELDYLTRRLGQNIERVIKDKKNSMAVKMSRLNNLSPLATLSRGYTVCRDTNGTVITSVNSVKSGDMVEVIVKDGFLECTVKGCKEERNV